MPVQGMYPTDKLAHMQNNIGAGLLVSIICNTKGLEILNIHEQGKQTRDYSTIKLP